MGCEKILMPVCGMWRFDGSLRVIALVCWCDPQKDELATEDALPEVVSTNARYLQLDVLPSVSLSSLDPFLGLLLGGHVTLLALPGPPGESLPSTSHRPPPPWSFTGSWILMYIDQAPVLKKIWVCHTLNPRPQDLKSVTYPEYHWAIRDIPVAHM